MKNKVELIGFYGSDEVISCSAWTSTSRDLTEKKRARIGNLINMLWSEGHETPFEKGVVHFLVDTDIASHIHLLKHRVSSLNAESARYKELKEDKYFLPEDWENIPVSEKLEHRKREYEAYIDSVLNEMHSISDTIRNEIKEIKKIRTDNREHLKFVSVDIQAAHAVAKHEKNIRRCSAAQLEAKNLMKEAVANISAFVLEAEAAEYILSLTSDEVAKASATISDLA